MDPEKIKDFYVCMRSEGVRMHFLPAEQFQGMGYRISPSTPMAMGYSCITS